MTSSHMLGVYVHTVNKLGSYCKYVYCELVMIGACIYKYAYTCTSELYIYIHAVYVHNCTYSLATVYMANASCIHTHVYMYYCRIII